MPHAWRVFSLLRHHSALNQIRLKEKTLYQANSNPPLLFLHLPTFSVIYLLNLLDTVIFYCDFEIISVNLEHIIELHELFAVGMKWQKIAEKDDINFN